jgi:hypothetical protein
VARELSGQVEIVPGVVGPQRILDDRFSIPATPRSIRVKVDIRFDPELHRYICYEFTARGMVTTEALRQTRIGDWVNQALLGKTAHDADQPIRVDDNPDSREPWGLTVPDDVTGTGPTDRALRWVAHIYRYSFAVSYNATKGVQELLKLPRSTAGRWIAAAREAGYLGPSEGTGRAGG